MRNSKQTSFFFLIKIYLQYAKGWFFVVCLSTLLSPLLAYIDVVILRDAVDFLELNSDISIIVGQMLVWLIVYLGVVILDSLIETYIGENMNTIVANKINRKIYTQILKTDYKYFDRTDFYNDYTWTLNNFYAQTFSSVQMVWQLLMSIFTIGTIGTLMISMDWVVLALVVLSVVMNVIINNALSKEAFDKKQESLLPQRILAYIQRVFYIKDYAMGIKTTGIKGVLLNKYDKSTSELSAVIKKHRGKVTVLSILTGAIIYSIKVLTILYLVTRVYNGKLSLGEFTALFYASINLKAQLDQFGNLLTRLKNLNLYTEGIKEFFNLPSEIESVEGGELLDDKPLSLKFQNVNFRYHDDSEMVLNNINFSINPGEKVAIVGRNGAGKSTIAKLLLHLYKPTSGHIYVDDKNICSLHVENLRHHIGVAFQDSMLYAFDVRENVNVYNEYISDDELDAILKKIGFSRVLAKNKANIDAVLTRELDDKGIELSGGERQLISIARVLTKKFGLLVFDEPSSSLDPIMESNLSKMIMKETNDTTVILISHRLSAVKSADKILFIENGQVIESGSHSELMKLKGKYCELYNVQAEGYRED